MTSGRKTRALATSFPGSLILPTLGTRLELREQSFQACAIDADCAVKPDGQNSVISFVISKWLLPELSFSDRWSRGMKTLETRLACFRFQSNVHEVLENNFLWQLASYPL